MPDDKHLGTLDLRNGDRVSLLQREIALLEKESSLVLPFVADMRINYDNVARELGHSSAAMVEAV